MTRCEFYGAVVASLIGCAVVCLLWPEKAEGNFDMCAGTVMGLWLAKCFERERASN